MFIPVDRLDETLEAYPTTPDRKQDTLHQEIKYAGEFVGEDVGHIAINLAQQNYLRTAPIAYHLPGAAKGNELVLVVTAEKGNLFASIQPLKPLEAGMPIAATDWETAPVVEPFAAGTLTGLRAEDGVFENALIPVIAEHFYSAR